MARLVSYRVNRRGLDALANSREVDSMLEHRAQAVATVAQTGFDARPPHSGRVEVEVLNDTSSDSDRSRVAVIARHPAALGIEADSRILGGAISAARA